MECSPVCRAAERRGLAYPRRCRPSSTKSPPRCRTSRRGSCGFISSAAVLLITLHEGTIPFPIRTAFPKEGPRAATLVPGGAAVRVAGGTGRAGELDRDRRQRRTIDEPAG